MGRGGSKPSSFPLSPRTLARDADFDPVEEVCITLTVKRALGDQTQVTATLEADGYDGFLRFPCHIDAPNEESAQPLTAQMLRNLISRSLVRAVGTALDVPYERSGQ